MIAIINLFEVLIKIKSLLASYLISIIGWDHQDAIVCSHHSSTAARTTLIVYLCKYCIFSSISTHLLFWSLFILFSGWSHRSTSTLRLSVYHNNTWCWSYTCATQCSNELTSHWFLTCRCEHVYKCIKQTAPIYIMLKMPQYLNIISPRFNTQRSTHIAELCNINESSDNICNIIKKIADIEQEVMYLLPVATNVFYTRIQTWSSM